MIRKFSIALLLIIPSLTFAIDLEGYYINAKGGVSKSFNTGVTSITTLTFQNEDLGSGTAFGISLGKYLSDNSRLELEAIKRIGYDFDTNVSTPGFTHFSDKAKIQTETLFINGFYDFQLFTVRNVLITPYIGGGVGISRNKIGTDATYHNGIFSGISFDGNTINQFAYKLSAGTLFSLTEQLSLDVNYQYVNLGSFKGGTKYYINGVRYPPSDRTIGVNGGEIKTQEIIVGLQYNFN